MDKLRDFLQSWPGRITMGLIMVPMAFLGVQGINGSGSMGGSDLIKAGNSVIDMSAYQSELNRYRTQLLQNNDASLINENAMANEVLESLINRALLQNQVHVLGMTVSDTEITRLIAQDENFHQNGQFSNEIFAIFLQQNGLTKDELFSRFRTELSVRQLTSGILGTAIYPSEEVSRLLDLQLEAREIWIHRLKWQDYAGTVSVSQAEIGDYYKANKESLVRPQAVDLSYIELTPLDVKVSAPTEDEINAQFSKYLQKNGLSDGRELAQILVSDVNKANEIKNKLDTGVSFELLAKQYSEDPSGANGGVIGKYNPSVFGRDVGVVNTALANLKVGGVSQPVKTHFGYHIFKVIKAGSLNVSDVRDELIQDVSNEKRQAAYNDLITKINTMAVDGMGISDIAAEVNLPMKLIKSYQKDNNNTALSQPVVVAAAFDDFTIQDQSVSPNITLADKTVWVQPTNYQEAKSLTLAEATAEIRARLTKQKSTRLALEAAEQMANDAKKNEGKSLMTASANFGISTRQNPQLNIQERASLFLHKSGKNDIWAVETDTGASVIVGSPVVEQATAQISPIERTQAAMMIRDNIGQDQLSDYLQYLRDTTKLTVNRDALMH